MHKRNYSGQRPFFFDQNVSVLIDQNFTLLVNQQDQIQGFTKRETNSLSELYNNHEINKS
jgi:hypothetical protein